MMHPMKRAWILSFTVPLVLSACGGISSGSTECTEQYWDGIIGMCLTDGWRVVDRDALVERGISEDVIVAFQSQTAVSGQFPTITVTKENLPQEMSAADYSEASIRSVTALPGYKQIDAKNVTVDGQALKLHIFSAQLLADEPERRFTQLSSTSKGAGYTFTALTPLSVNKTLEGQISTMMTSVSFTAPEGAASSD